MKKVKKIIAAAMISIFAISVVGCNMIEKTPEAIKKSPVAKVGDETITKAQLDERMDSVIKQMKMQYGEDFDKSDQGKEAISAQKTQLLESMIEQKVILQKAKELKLVPDDAKLKEEADKKYNDIKKTYNDDAKFKEALKAAGFTDESLKQYLKEQVIQENVQNSVTKDVKVDDKKVQEYYNNNQMKFTEKPDTMKVSHILFKTEDEAKKAKERIDKGEDFAKLAKELGTDGTKDKGGDLGEIPYDSENYDKTFMAAAMALKQGVVSSPVHTQFGWHLIKVTEKHEYPVKKFETVKEDIRAQLLTTAKQDAYAAKVKEWKDKAKIQKYEKNM